MNKQKNVQQEVDSERKKEHVSVLERIRRRTGLLVGIVGLALVIFILESLLGSGASIFGGNEMAYIGSIGGKKIERNEFLSRYEMQLNNYRQRNQGREADDATKTQAIESIWQQYIIDLVMKPQFDEIGINVGEDELYETVVVNPVQTIVQNLTDPNTGKVNEQFSRPDGTLDPVKWRQAVQNVTGDNEMAVRNMEEQVKNSRYFEKFRALVKNGLYVTKAEAQQKHSEERGSAALNYVIKKFDSVSDSTIQISESDIKNYYSSNSFRYTNPEASRSLEYVVFDVMPSAEDLAALEKEARRIASEFKGLTVGEDSSYIAQESENGSINIQNFTKKTMIVRDSSIYTSAPGTVFGPYNEGAYFKVYKLQAVNSVADSSRIRHILVGTTDPQSKQPIRSVQQAKKEADSVLVLLKEKKVSFDSLVTSYSNDMGSRTNGGDYGWFDEAAGFVAPFKYAGLMGTKGNLSVVETEFGYHIIEVLDVSKTRHTSYKVAQIFKAIQPSDETNQSVFGIANQFAGENNTGELFNKAVADKKLTKRLAENLRDGDYQMPGLDGVKEIVKWAYTANKGEVNIFTLQNRHVVAHLSAIKNKGVLPIEDVKEEVTTKAIQQKKAEIFMKEFESKAAGSKSVEDVASKLGLDVKRAENVMYQQRMVEGLGQDNIFVGTAFGVKTGAISKVTVGENGVFVLAVSKLDKGEELKDLAQKQRELEATITGRTDYEIFNALKEMSDIEFHKSRID
jgi:peptidyl-prolyl cis-trans isomerase D